MSTNTVKKIYVTASEIGDFIYCPRVWWLRLNDKSNQEIFALEEGRRQHDVLLRELKRADIAFFFGIALIGIGVALLLLSISFRWLTGTI